MLDYVRTIITSEFDAALSMLRDCIDKCPAEHWDGIIAKYPFWQVAYHTLCFVDCYLYPGDAAVEFHPVYHPAGRAELDEEYPSRRFTQPEMSAYLRFCRERMHAALQRETAESLHANCGFPHLPMSRGELHLYNIRHIMHHTGQLSAYLRRHGAEPRWTKMGWRD